MKISLKDLNIYKNLLQMNKIKHVIKENMVNICVRHQILEESYEIKVTSKLVTNSIFCDFLNITTINYYPKDSYVFFNCINQTNKIKYNLETGKYYVEKGFENHPVRGVNWYGALLFAYMCDGRLLTELEFESIVKDIDYTKCNYGNKYGLTTPVDFFNANEDGIFDSMGNLRVWCMDVYDPKVKYVCNCEMELIEDTYYRVVKGNAWDKTDIHFDKYLHEGKWARVGTMGIGFRVVIGDYPIKI